MLIVKHHLNVSCIKGAVLFLSSYILEDFFFFNGQKLVVILFILGGFKIHNLGLLILNVQHNIRQPGILINFI